MEFEDVYTYLMDDSVYEQWLEIIKEVVPNKPQASLLDLACGTGELTYRLAQLGFQVTGYDWSEDMLSRADQRLGHAGLTYHLVKGDMRDLSALPTYQVVLSSLDSLCYLESKAEVKGVFQEVCKHIEDRGFFFFDVHSTYQMETVFADYSYHYVEEDFAFCWTSFPEEKYAVTHEMDLFVKEGELYRRTERVIKERTYPLESYLQMLNEVGFHSVGVYTDYPSQEIDPKGTRWYFICQKERKKL